MSKANCTYKFQTAAGPVTIQGMANMKAWLAVNGVESIIREPAVLQARPLDAQLEAASDATLPVFAALGAERFELRQAVEDASRIAGFTLSTEVDIVPLGDRTIQHFDPATGRIAINSRRYITRGLAAESLLEEWIHALDNASPNRQFSAGSKRLAITSGAEGWIGVGDIAKEAIAQRGSGSIIDRFLSYPLDSPDLSVSRTQAELFARLGVLYIAHGDVMKRAMPSTYEAYHEIFSTIRSNDQLATPESLRGEVRGDELGGRAQGVRDSGDLGRSDGDPAQRAATRSARRLGASDIDAFQRASVRAIGARTDGGIVQGTLSSQGVGVSDIRFRTVRSAVSEAVNDFREVALPVGYKVNDIIKATPGKMSWWHKSVGTQYDLAQREPLFKRVFDGAQRFLNDVSFYAREASDLAPSILPTLETLGDVRKQPISPEDSKAIARPIFEGTLIWGRDPSTGRPVKMDVLEARAAELDTQAKAQEMIRRDLLDPKVLRMWQGLPLDQYTSMVENKYAKEVLKPGTVFTDRELKDLFGLNDKQTKLYREFRKAVNKSLGNLAITDMVRFGGKDVEAVRERALAADNPRMAAKILRDHLLEQADMNPARAEVLTDTGNRMLDKAEKAVELMDQGYAPLMRFGQYTVDVVDESGERVYFGMFESGREANKMARQMQANYPQGQVVQGTLSEEQYKLFSGVSPETVELFGDMLGLEADGDSASDTAFQEYLKRMKANRSAMKRLIHRKGIAGFSEEPGRVLAGFLYSNARQSSSNVHMGEITQAVADIPKTKGELKDHAMRLRDYVMNPQEEAQAFRSILFAQYLGGSIASALLNAMQPVQVTFPWLSQFTTVGNAGKQMSAAIKDVLGKSKLDARLQKALHKAEEEGIVSPQEIHQLQAQASGRAALVGGDGTKVGNLLATGNNALSRVSLVWGKLFAAAEQFNRRTTFIAAYRIAVDSGMTDPEAFARRAVDETQFIYNKGNKPRWARGVIGSVLFTFKQYSVSYVELLHRMHTQGGPEGKKAALLGLGVLFLLSGSDGLPFAEDIQDVIDGAMQRMGYNFNSREAKEQFFIDLIGEGGARFIEKGLSGLPGSPVDVAGRFGLGNLIPGTGAFYRKEDYGRDMLELLGPAGDFGRRMIEAGEKTLKGEVFGSRGAIMTASPVAVRNMGLAYEMHTTGMYMDRNGRKVADVDSFDAMWKSIGIQPFDVAKIQGASWTVQQTISFNRLREREIADKWAKGVFLGDAGRIEQARAELAEWNAKNPDFPIRIQPNQIAQRVRSMRLGREERLARTAPSEIRARVLEELAQGTR